MKENNSTVEQMPANYNSSSEEVELSNDLRKLDASNSSQLLPPSTRQPTTLSSSTIPRMTHSTSSVPPTSTPKSKETKLSKEPKPVLSIHDRIHEVNDRNVYQNDDDGEEASDPETQNGSIVIENPEYLRISWTTDTKKYRLNLYNGTESNPNVTSKVQIRHEIPNVYNITKFTVRGKPKL